MAEHLQDDLNRFRSLHSYYKYPPKSIINLYPLLTFGQQPYQPISPDTNPIYDLTLRWWFLLDANIEDFESLFEKEHVKAIWKASQQCVSAIKIHKLGSMNDTSIIQEITANALKFYELTKDIYEEIIRKQQSTQICPICAQIFFKSFGCFGSTCNRSVILIYPFKNALSISSESKKVTCKDKDDKDLLTFVMDRFQNSIENLFFW